VPASEFAWTSFEMELREPSPLPSRPLDLAQFIATSITFTTHIRQISVYLDDECLFKISKATGVQEHVKIPSFIKRGSQIGYMKMDSVATQPIVITASVMRWVYTVGSDSTIAKSKALAKVAAAQASIAKPTSQGFFSSLSNFFGSTSTPAPPPAPPVDMRSEIQKLSIDERRELIEMSVQLQIFAASVSVKLPSKVAIDIERATKKKSPSTLRYQIIYVRFLIPVLFISLALNAY
jgi:hypothetical protein